MASGRPKAGSSKNSKVTDQPPAPILVISNIIRAVQAEAHVMGFEFTLLNDQVKEMAKRAEVLKGKQNPGKAGLN